MTSKLLSKNNTKLIFSAIEDKNYELFLMDKSDVVKIKTRFSYDKISPLFIKNGKAIIFSQFNGKNFVLTYFDLESEEETIIFDRGFDSHSISNYNNKITWIASNSKNFEEMKISNVFYMDMEDLKPIQLTDNDMINCYPKIMQDSKVVFESGYLNNPDKPMFGLFEVDIQSCKINELAYDSKTSGNGIPSVYKNKIVFERSEFPFLDVYNSYLYNYETKKISKISNFDEVCNVTPNFSNNGKFIASHCSYNSGKNSKLIIFNSNNSLEKKEFALDYKYLKLPKWDKDDTLLICEEVYNKNLIIFNFETKESEIIDFASYRGQRFMEIYNFDIF